MKRFRSIAIFVLVGIMVMCIGALAGWYLVLKSKGQTISWQDAARGFGISAPSSGVNGSTFNNIGVGGGAPGGSGTGAQGFSVGGGPGAVNPGTAGITGGAFGGTTIAGTDASSSAPIPTTATSTNSKPPKTPRLWHATKTPVAGFAFTNTQYELLFAERATGYVFRASDFSGEILRKTNTLIPKIYEAYFDRAGGVIYRGINEVTGATQTFSGIIGTSTSAGVGGLTGTNLPNNIQSLAANPDTGTIVFFSSDIDGKSVAVSEPWVAGKAGKATTVFTSSVGSWKPFALSDGRIIIAQKPQDNVSGSAFVIKDNRPQPIVRAAPGLTILPLANSDTFVFGTSNRGVLTLFAQTSTTTYALSIKTVADKCVWAPYKPPTRSSVGSNKIIYCAVPSNSTGKNFLENWYMGAAHPSDSWWRINLTTGKSDQILSKSETPSNIDVIDPAIDPSGNILAFKNNIDGTLWVLRIAQ